MNSASVWLYQVCLLVCLFHSLSIRCGGVTEDREEIKSLG